MVIICPAGHPFEIPDVVYGYPTPETFDAAERGEVTLGGCVPDIPIERQCPTCGLPAAAEWASERASGDDVEGEERDSELPA